MVASAPCRSSRACLRAALALTGAGLVACGGPTQVNAPGPVAPTATTGAAAAALDSGATDADGSDAGAHTADLDSAQVSATPPSEPVATELHLPWTAGETWFLTSGPHSERRAALDFAPPNLDPRTGKVFADTCSRKRGDAYWVRAAADGHFSAVLRKNCPCVQIRHDDGVTTNYFHLRRSSVKKLGYKVGDTVKAGQRLGHPSCEVGPAACGATHPPTGVHVHFYRTDLATAARLPANGMMISGWTVKALARQREGVMTKGDEVRQTRGKLLGWACSPATAACDGKRNDLETDLVPFAGEEPPAVARQAITGRQARAP